MNEENYYYTDLPKAHKLFCQIEGRWRFYDAYMESRDHDAWFRSPQIPLKEGLLLFGFIQSWDPNFKGELWKFLETYKDLFDMIKQFREEKILQANLTSQKKNAITIVFDRIARCTPGGRRYESTDTSKILHAIIPRFFVMWEDKIRKAIVGEGRDGRCYAFEFLPKMQELAQKFIDSYIKEKGGNSKSALNEIEFMGEKPIAKLLDEFNFVRYRKRKSLAEIRAVSL